MPLSDLPAFSPVSMQPAALAGFAFLDDAASHKSRPMARNATSLPDYFPLSNNLHQERCAGR